MEARERARPLKQAVINNDVSIWYESRVTFIVQKRL